MFTHSRLLHPKHFTKLMGPQVTIAANFLSCFVLFRRFVCIDRPVPVLDAVVIRCSTMIKEKKMNKKPYSSYQRGITNYRAANLFDERFVFR